MVPDAERVIFDGLSFLMADTGAVVSEGIVVAHRSYFGKTELAKVPAALERYAGLVVVAVSGDPELDPPEYDHSRLYCRIAAINVPKDRTFQWCLKQFRVQCDKLGVGEVDFSVLEPKPTELRHAVRLLLNAPASLLYLWFESHAIRAAGIKTSRAAAFRTLVSLCFGATFFPGRRKSCVHKILGYRMRCESHAVLFALFRKVFLTASYAVPAGPNVKCIVDCGSHVGMSVLFFRLRYPSAEIHAFEPNPQSFALLSENIEANQLRGITLHNIAFANGQGEAAYYCPKDRELEGTTRKGVKDCPATPVRTERLSDHLKRLGEVGIVKINVQGAEVDILQDLVSTGTLQSISRMAIEYQHQVAGEKGRLSSFLHAFEACGFRYNVKADYRRTGSSQKVLLHLYKRRPGAVTPAGKTGTPVPSDHS